jgi:uncharacterized membrane protein YeaQ/YmgE (transglycosylase-associated protein family)
MGIIAWIVLGLGAGLLANMVIPGRRSQGLILTCVIGIVGALLGGWLATKLFHVHTLHGFFNLSTWLTAIVGAAILLLAYHLITSRSASTGRSRSNGRSRAPGGKHHDRPRAAGPARRRRPSGSFWPAGPPPARPGEPPVLLRTRPRRGGHVRASQDGRRAGARGQAAPARPAAAGGQGWVSATAGARRKPS